MMTPRTGISAAHAQIHHTKSAATDEGSRPAVGNGLIRYLAQHLQVQWHFFGSPPHWQEQPSGPHSQFLQHWHLH
jgi:hypothetical protein